MRGSSACGTEPRHRPLAEQPPGSRGSHATKGRDGSKTELLSQMLSQTKFQLQPKRSPEPGGGPSAESAGIEASRSVAAQLSSDHQTPKEGEYGTATSKAMSLSQFHIFHSVGLQDILQRESNATV